MNVRSEPILARTDDSLRLKRTAVIVSVEVGNVRFDIGALLEAKSVRVWTETRTITLSHPIFEQGSRQWQIKDLNDGGLWNCTII